MKVEESKNPGVVSEKKDEEFLSKNVEVALATNVVTVGMFVFGFGQILIEM